VRKQGDKVRVTAQLIQASDGFHLWSETYDGDLSDVFALQERIARAITDQLKVVLEGGQAERLVQTGTTNAEAYALYLQASATFNRRDGTHFPDAAAQLEQALKLDPAFARAYGRAASLYVVMPVYTAFDSRKAREWSRRTRRMRAGSIRSWRSPTPPSGCRAASFRVASWPRATRSSARLRSTRTTSPRISGPASV
jgi:hypothetical protein